MMIAIYVFAYMGFGIHTCSIEGTKDFILMFGDTSCEAIHRHYHEHHIPHEHLHNGTGDCIKCLHQITDEDESCCVTDIFVLTDEQASSDNSLHIFLNSSDLPLHEGDIAESATPSSPLDYGIEFLSAGHLRQQVLSVWRI